MKKLFFIGLLVGGLCGCGVSLPEDTLHRESSDVISFYYQQPDLEKLLDELTYLDEQPELDPNILAPLLGFLAGLSISQPEQFEVLTQHVTWQRNMRPVMEKVIQVASDLQKDISAGKMPHAAKNPAGLDFMWGAFSATGDPQFAEVVYRTLQDEQTDSITRAAAEWSLASQREQHPVLEEWFSKKETSGNESLAVPSVAQ
jgi:hypothetical protein